MIDYQENLLGILTVTIILIGVVSVVLFRLGFPRRPGWLPGMVFLLTMLAVAISAFLTLFYDHGASVIQGVTLVAMTVCGSIDTKTSAQSSAF